ncbi:tetratricopeptide repeat protein [Bacteroidota bacterium]
MRKLALFLILVFLYPGVWAQSGQNSFILKFAPKTVIADFAELESVQSEIITVKENGADTEYHLEYNEDGKSAGIQKKQNGTTVFNFNAFDEDGKMIIKELPSGNILTTIKHKGSGIPRFSTNGKYLAFIGTNQKTAFVYIYKNDKGWKEVNKFDFDKEKTGGARSLVFTPDSKTLYISFNNKFILKYNTENHAEPEQLKGMVFNLIYLNCSKDGNYLIGNAMNKTTVIDLDKWKMGGGISENGVSNYFFDDEKASVSKSISPYNKNGIGIVKHSSLSGYIIYNSTGEYYYTSNSLENYFYFNNGEENILLSKDNNHFVEEILWADEFESFDAKNTFIKDVIEEIRIPSAEKYKIISWGEPFSFDEAYQFFTQGGKNSNAYFCKQVIEEYITKSDEELDNLGQEKCQAIKSALDKYKELEKDESDIWAYQADVEELLERMEKRSSNLYYMAIDELLEKGNTALESGKALGVKTPALALMFFNRIAELEPNDPIHQCRIGVAYVLHNMFPEALESFNKAQAISPNHPRALWGLYKVAEYNFATNFALGIATNQMAESVVKQADAFLQYATLIYAKEISDVESAKQIMEIFLISNKAYELYVDASLNGIERAEALEEAYNLCVNKMSKENEYHFAMRTAQAYKVLADEKSNLENPGQWPYHEKAIEFYDLAKKTGLADAQIYFEQIILLQDLKQTEKVNNYYKEAITKFPDEPNLIWLKRGIEFNLARTKVYNGKYAEAQNAIVDYIENQENPINDCYMIAGLIFYHKKNYPEAVKYFDKYVPYIGTVLLPDMFPNYKDLHQYSKSPGGTAPIIINNAIIIDKNYKILNEIIPLVQNEEGTERIPDLLEIIKVYEKFNVKRGLAITYNLLGVAYYNDEKDNLAMEYYKKSIEAESNWNTHPYLNLVSDLTYNKKYFEALEILEKFIKEFPKETSTYNEQKADIHYTLGHNYFQEYEFQNAINYYDKYLEFEEDPETHIFTGMSYYQLNNLNKAKEEIRKAFNGDYSLREKYPDAQKILDL